MKRMIFNLMLVVAICVLYVLHFMHAAIMESMVYSTILLFIIIISLVQLYRDEKQIRGAALKQKKEFIEADQSTKLLIRRDLDLRAANQKLDQKMVEVENSERSLLVAYHKIESEKEKTLAIVSSLTDPIIVLDNENKISLFNSAAQKTLGLRFSDFGSKVENKNNFELGNFKGIIRRDFIFRKVVNQEDPEKNSEEASLVNENQNLVFKVMTEKIFGKDKEYLGTMKIFYDLTREKMIDKMKSEFISIAAHQLRTPLSAIKWVIQMALDEDVGKLNKEQKELLTKGFQSNERMITLVNDLLDVSRIEDGRYEYSLKEGNFEDVIEVVIENIEKLIAKHHIKFVLEKPEKFPNVVMDKERIILAFQNLVDNAIKYTPEYGSVEVKIVEEKGYLKVAVKDNGVGIPKGDQAKLFSKFFRASNVVRMETEGTGLGLFISKNIVEQHGGKINMKSEEGHGTEIIFTIPIKIK
jgi:signal transduction histidine kinase